jgi:DNA helicase-2/ATP-dependent DNA helicase PcrA
VKPAGEAVRLHQAADEYQEAAWVVDRIVSLRETGRAAVLFRMNAQSRLFEEGLMRHRIPYEVVGGVGFYEREEVKDLLSYLRLVVNPRDPIALRRVINVPARGIGDKTVDEVTRHAAARGVSPWEALTALAEGALLPARAAQPLRRFREMILGLREDAARLGVKGLLTRTLEVTGYAAALAQETTQESQDRLENLAELLSAAADYEARDESPTLAGFLDRVSLLTDVDRSPGQAPILLMTFHAAKGLEFASVFLVGLEEGLVPHSRSASSAEALEEERRLVYVGMTRAMERLHVTWAQSRQVFGQRRLCEPSRFLTEIPRDRLEVTADAVYEAPLRERPPPVWRPRPSAAVLSPPPAGVPGELRPGVKVRHPLFGVGTVLRSEGAGDDLKLTVSFTGIGAKRLVARYAGLELA